MKTTRRIKNRVPSHREAGDSCVRKPQIKTVRTRARHKLGYAGKFSVWTSTEESITMYFGGNETRHYVWNVRTLEWDERK